MPTAPARIPVDRRPRRAWHAPTRGVPWGQRARRARATRVWRSGSCAAHRARHGRTDLVGDLELLPGVRGAGCGKAIHVARWAPGFLRRQPLVLEEPAIREPHENGIQRAREQLGRLGQLVAVVPLARLIHQAAQQVQGLSGRAAYSGHVAKSTYVALEVKPGRGTCDAVHCPDGYRLRLSSTDWRTSSSSTARSTSARLFIYRQLLPREIRREIHHQITRP